MNGLPGFDMWLTNAPEPGLDPLDFPDERPSCISCGEELVKVTVWAGAPAVLCLTCEAFAEEAVSRHFRWLPMCDGEWDTVDRQGEEA